MNTDIGFLHDLRDDLAEAVRAEREAWTLREVRRPRSWLRGRRAAVLGSAGLVCAGAALALVVPGRHQPRRTARGTSAEPQVVTRGPGPGFSLSAPLIGGRVVSLAAASTDIGQPLPLSTAPPADPSTMGRVFEVATLMDSGGKDTFVAVTYPNSSVVVEYEAPVPYADPAANYRSYVNQTPANLGGLASVGRVGSHPALIIHENRDATGSNPASVEFVRRGLKIVVIGFRPAATLLAVARSIDSAAASGN